MFQNVHQTSHLSYSTHSAWWPGQQNGGRGWRGQEAWRMAPTKVDVTRRDIRSLAQRQRRSVRSRLPTPGPCAALLTPPPAAARIGAPRSSSALRFDTLTGRRSLMRRKLAWILCQRIVDGADLSAPWDRLPACLFTDDDRLEAYPTVHGPSPLAWPRRHTHPGVPS